MVQIRFFIRYTSKAVLRPAAPFFCHYTHAAENHETDKDLDPWMVKIIKFLKTKITVATSLCIVVIIIIDNYGDQLKFGIRVTSFVRYLLADITR